MEEDQKQLYVRLGDVEMKANSPEEMEKLAKIIDTLPKSFLIRLGKLYASGHGKEVMIIF